jgi:CRP-like cAMP-binding protein
LALFKGFTDNEFSRFTRFLHSLNLEANQTAYGQGSLAVSFYLVASGSVALQRTRPDGKMDRLVVVTPGHALGLAALWPEEARHAESAITLEPCVLLALVRQDFFMLEKKAPVLAIKLLRALQQETYQEWLGAREEFHSLSARLAKANILI